jgi:hypothetical protein
VIAGFFGHPIFSKAFLIAFTHIRALLFDFYQDVQTRIMIDLLFEEIFTLIRH